MATSRVPAGRKPVRKAIDPALLEQRRFTRKVRAVFLNMGFTAIPTEGKHAKFGIRKGELDSVFIYDNVILIVEETTSAKAFDHAKKKRIVAEQILGNKKDFIGWLRDEFPAYEPLLAAYVPQRFKFAYLYVSQREMDLDDDELEVLKPMRVLTTRALSYFDKLAKTIRKSARTDLWRYLELKSTDLGPSNATAAKKTIETTIISPSDSTGFSNGVRLVSFMISADTLLRNSYVLRKDNWGYSIDLYQRLIEVSRIKKIRQYVAKEGSVFLNNIIVGLPSNVRFHTADDESTQVDLDDIQDYESYRMTIPDEFNSLCIIDGQHRVFAHYEGVDDLESKVAKIRSKVHLLATGLVFPPDMNDLDRLRLQGEIFLDINSNSKPVPPDVLLAIQSLRAPYADVAVARRVLEALNKKSAFKGLFQLSQMDGAPIKIASIVKFALRYLVDIEADAALFDVWSAGDPKRVALREKDDPELLREYVDFVASALNEYFNAFRATHGTGWGEASSKVTSTTVINAMIIALRRSIPSLGLLNFDRYVALMGSWSIDFSKETFLFSSSQYNRFAQDVLRDMFRLVEKDGGWSRGAINPAHPGGSPSG